MRACLDFKENQINKLEKCSIIAKTYYDNKKYGNLH